MISASISAASRTGPLPDRERPRPPRRRFFFAPSPWAWPPCFWSAAAGAAGRVSPICGLRAGWVDAGRGAEAWPSGCSPPSPGLRRFLPPRDPRRRFLGPSCPSGRFVRSALAGRLLSAADAPLEPLVSMKFPLSRRARGAPCGSGCCHNWRGRPFGLDGQVTREDYRKRRMWTLWTRPIMMAKATVWDPP